jgi:four helix bundle protein
MTIKRFEDIESWKEARKLTAAVYLLCRQKPLASDYSLCDQIRRCSVSIMSNIAEGFGRDGNREFIQFLSLSKGSASELKSLLYVLLDNQFITASDFQRFYEQGSRIEILLTRFITYLRKSPIRGQKFNPL